MRKLISTIYCVVILSFVQQANATLIKYDNFKSVAGLSFYGNARPEGGQRVRLAHSTRKVAGAVYSDSLVNISTIRSFSTKFVFNMNSPHGGGADGLAFVIRPESSRALGGNGAGLGYFGI